MLDFDEKAHLRELKHAVDNIAFRLTVTVDHKLDTLLKGMDRMKIDTVALTASVDQIKADQAKNAADIKAALAALVVATTPGSEPAAVQAAIDQAVSDLTAVASGMEASNSDVESALNPPAPTV